MDEPTTLTFEPDAGGMHSAPLLGESGVVVTRYRLAWQDLSAATPPMRFWRCFACWPSSQPA
jgi:hypothetical protein